MNVGQREALLPEGLHAGYKRPGTGAHRTFSESSSRLSDSVCRFWRPAPWGGAPPGVAGFRHPPASTHLFQIWSLSLRCQPHPSLHPPRRAGLPSPEAPREITSSPVLASASRSRQSRELAGHFLPFGTDPRPGTRCTAGAQHALFEGVGAGRGLFLCAPLVPGTPRRSGREGERLSEQRGSRWGFGGCREPPRRYVAVLTPGL